MVEDNKKDRVQIFAVNQEAYNKLPLNLKKQACQILNNWIQEQISVINNAILKTNIDKEKGVKSVKEGYNFIAGKIWLKNINN